jgi:hypothetical protein
MNLMPVIKLMGWELVVNGGTRWREAGLAVHLTTLGLALACCLSALAQEPEAPAQTNDVPAAEVLSQLSDLVQAADSVQPEDMAPSNSVPQVSGLPEANGTTPGGDRAAKVNRFDNPGRSQKDDRRARGRRSSRSNSDPSGGYGSANDYSRGSANSLAGTNNGGATLDYAAFKLIVDRNIFDPNRIPHGPGTPRVRQTPKSFDSLTLVGTMTYEKGTFAFFDGTSSEYKKALRLADVIAGYKVTNISPNGVKLASGTNQLELSVGAQLRREENGPWRPSSQFTSYAPTPASTSTNASATTSTAGSDTASAGAESDIIKRLMQKREKE